MQNEINQYFKAHDDLMCKWKSRHKAAGYKAFVSDGIVCPQIWFSQTTRVLFVIKEAYSNDNDTNSDWNLLGYLNTVDGSKGRIWSAIAEWQHALENTTQENMPVFDNWLGCCIGDMTQYRKAKMELLKKCAIVNIKKSNGRNGSTDADLLEYVKQDWDFLKRQIEIIAPTIVVCGSTFHLLKDYPKESTSKQKQIFGAESCNIPQDRGCKRIGNTTVISYFHPANHYPAALNYYGIAGMYHNYLKEQEN